MNQARDKNSQARLFNSVIRHRDVGLRPLVKISNDAVADFPWDVEVLSLLLGRLETRSVEPS